MYFGQTVHPLNFNYTDSVRVAAVRPDGGVEFSGAGFQVGVSCTELGDFCTKLSLDSSHVADKTNYSDGIAPEWRDAGRDVAAAEVRERGAQRKLARSAGSAKKNRRGGAGTDPDTGRFVFTTACAKIVADARGLHLAWTTGGELSTPPAAGVLPPARTSSSTTTTPAVAPAPLFIGGLGTNGSQTILNFWLGDAGGPLAAYGFGERTRGLNKLGKRMECWNVDVVDVHAHHHGRDDYDPMYVAIPLAILKTGTGHCVGLYFDNPERTVLDVGKRLPGVLMYQALGSNTDLYLLAGPTLRDVVRNFSTLTGRGELPPLWALGHHQCRWGYENEEDLLHLQEKFARFDIPVSAFWYDIDYMDGYRVFTWDPADFPDPGRFNRALKADGIHTVAIVDPGVKREGGYRVYDAGRRRGVFCQTGHGREFVGNVWPGETVFPDFTQERARDWWARELADWMKASALDGAWLDMNDPATSETSPDEMHFGPGGEIAHEKFHNQYAHFMAMASRAACDRLDADSRPFLLTRSGYTGTQRFSAIWTGDNSSNWPHLRMSIPCTLNLGLSGVAFNGPDVGGFLGNTTEELLTRWYQAGWLFPFFRNHSVRDSKPQEPWQFGSVACERIADVIRTRYRILPYLYQVFFEHWRKGDPVLRPMVYHYGDTESGWENVDDQFLLGDALLHAPMLYSREENPPVTLADGTLAQLRDVRLPAGWWFDLNRGRWVEGGRALTQYAVGFDESPLFVRDGAIVPFFNGPLHNALTDYRKLELHIFSREKPARLTFYADDGKTRAYQRGGYRALQIEASFFPEVPTKREGASATVEITGGDTDVGQAATTNVATPTFTTVFYGTESLGAGPVEARLMRDGRTKKLTLHPATRRWVSREISVFAM